MARKKKDLPSASIDSKAAPAAVVGEKHRQAVARWQAKNMDKVLAASSRWRRRNLSKKNALQLAFQKRHPERINARNAMRRALKRNAIPAWANRTYINDMYMLAQLVSETTGEQHHVDHIVPLKSKLVCGLHVADNLQVISGRDNNSKSNLRWPLMP